MRGVRAEVACEAWRTAIRALRLDLRDGVRIVADAVVGAVVIAEEAVRNDAAMGRLARTPIDRRVDMVRWNVVNAMIA